MVLQTMNFVLVVMRNKLILIGCLLNIFGYLWKVCCLSKIFRLVYLKTDMTLHSYVLLQKQHRIGKNASPFGTDNFSN